jgi:hypothetical protein
MCQEIMKRGHSKSFRLVEEHEWFHPCPITPHLENNETLDRYRQVS